ncbi:MAG: MBL fold metallo-hydrolase [Pseudomonadota bacterium]
MTRLAILFVSAAALPLLASAHGGTLHVAQQQPPVQVTTTDLGDGIYMLQGRGGNLGVLDGEDGVFVIDSQYDDMAFQNLYAIGEITNDVPHYLVNTHWHGDHVGGNAKFEDVGALIIAHDNVRERVSTDQTMSIAGTERDVSASPVEAWPVITFDDDMTLHLNGQTVRLVHLPDAHTDGDTMIVFEDANVFHMGDVMFSGMFPFIDIGSGGSVEGYLAALQKAYDMADETTKIIPGHGPLSTREDIAMLRDMLADARDAVQAEIDAGKSLEQTLDARPLEPWVDDWASAFMTEPRFTTILYSDLSQAD